MQWHERIGRRLKPRDLHVFLMVAEKGNMAKAAEALAISRPVVSKTIATLEQTLGVPLLDRTSSGVEPTLYGRALVKRGRAVFDELQHSVAEIEFLADPGTGTLRIGMTEVSAAGLVPAAIDRLCKRYPRISVYTEQGDGPTVIQFLRDRRCEVGVVRLHSPHPDLEFRPLFYEQVFVVAGVRSRWARRTRIALAELLEERWIQSPMELEPGSPALRAFQTAGLAAPRVVISSGSLNLRYGLLATGRFVTMIPESVLRFGPRRAPVRILPIKLPRWHIPTCVVTLKHRTVSPLTQIFIETLQELAKPLRAR